MSAALGTCKLSLDSYRSCTTRYSASASNPIIRQTFSSGLVSIKIEYSRVRLNFEYSDCRLVDLRCQLKQNRRFHVSGSLKILTMGALSATWRKKIKSPQLQRSSNNVASIDQNIYVFGGELKPREPRDSDVYSMKINNASELTSDGAEAMKVSSEVKPSARVGAACTALNGQMFVFSGRGGIAMAPIEERGKLWVFDVKEGRWSNFVPSVSEDPYPAGRSYHAMTSNGVDTIYIHAGCPEKGRLNDLWAFHIPTKAWKELAAAPGSPRGGSSMVFSSGKLYRMNGFDGTVELGGAIDIYDIVSNKWATFEFPADGKDGPGARSVSALLSVSIKGNPHLITLFGESDPSSLGHQGAGKMLSDLWAFDMQTHKWTKVEPRVSGGADEPAARGWFAADTLDGKSGIVVAGGLAEDNSRLGDVWTLEF